MNIRKITEELGIRPSKKLGQNFLLHQNTSKMILDWANIPEKANVIEIGPGLGALTFELMEREHPVFLIEKDRKLFEFLREKITPNSKLVNEDVLDFSFEDVFPNESFHLISNAPYSISTPIIEKALEQKHRTQQMIFLFQEEVVDRICAVPGNKDYGRLSIWVQCQCDIERGPRISRENFFPKPDVESRLVRITPSVNPLVPKNHQEGFLHWVAKIFQHRRKTLRKNLKEMGFDSIQIEKAFSTSYTPMVRAEVIGIKDLFCIFQNLHKL